MYKDGCEERDDHSKLRPPTDQENHARRHPLRFAILAILASGTRTAGGIRHELPENPSLAVLRYHLGVLREAELVSEREEHTRRIFSLA